RAPVLDRRGRAAGGARSVARRGPRAVGGARAARGAPRPLPRRRARLAGEPVRQCRVARLVRRALELRAELAGGAEALRDDVVRVDRLEVEQARDEEVAVAELRI